MNDMDRLLDEIEKAYSPDWESVKSTPAIKVAKGLRDYLINKHSWDLHYANQFVLKAQIIVWNESSDEQVERCIEFVSKIFDGYLESFKDFACSQEDFVAGADKFYVNLTFND